MARSATRTSFAEVNAIAPQQPPSAHNSNPRYNVKGRYQALLSAGETLLCQGYDQAQPKKIAEAAGVSVGLFYKHFEDKRSLLSAVMVWRLSILHEQIEQAIAQETQAMQQLAIVIEQTLSYFHQNAGLTKLFFMQIGYGDAVATDQLSGSRQNYRRILQSVLEKGIEQNQFAPLSPPELDLMINSIVGTINWTLYDKLVVQGEEIAPHRLAVQLMKLFERSLCR